MFGCARYSPSKKSVDQSIVHVAISIGRLPPSWGVREKPIL